LVGLFDQFRGTVVCASPIHRGRHPLPLHVLAMPRWWRDLDMGLSPVKAGSAAAVVGTFLALASRLAAKSRPKPLTIIALSSAMRLLQEKQVQELVYMDGGALLLRLKEDGQALCGSGAQYATRLVPGGEMSVFSLAQQHVPSFRYRPTSRSLAQVLSALVPLVLIYIWYIAVKSLMHRDEKYSPTKRGRKQRGPATTFDDVVSRSKVELTEIVDYLNRPESYRKAGARLPRGVLLAGPSGTGKTLLARAVAGEARCAFISSSASEFVEVYVGRGAARVRDLFRQAREAAPAVLFIDELDALGSRTRNGDGRSTNEEYVQTLNQLLTELDGFHGHSDGVVVIAATNRHESIDAALLRPGRFDRHVHVELPDESERLEILKIHTRRVPMAAKADLGSTLGQIAAASVGFSGAELANVVNEAVFLALREQHACPTPQDFQAALCRAQVARQRAGDAATAEGFRRSLFGLVMPSAAAAR